jgi:hypothetical protein
MAVKNEIYTRFRHQTLKQMVHLEEKDLRGRIILKLIYSNAVEMYGRYFFGLRAGTNNVIL